LLGGICGERLFAADGQRRRYRRLPRAKVASIARCTSASSSAVLCGGTQRSKKSLMRVLVMPRMGTACSFSATAVAAVGAQCRRGDVGQQSGAGEQTPFNGLQLKVADAIDFSEGGVYSQFWCK